MKAIDVVFAVCDACVLCGENTSSNETASDAVSVAANEAVSVSASGAVTAAASDAENVDAAVCDASSGDPANMNEPAWRAAIVFFGGLLSGAV